MTVSFPDNNSQSFLSGIEFEPKFTISDFYNTLLLLFNQVASGIKGRYQLSKKNRRFLVLCMATKYQHDKT